MAAANGSERGNGDHGAKNVAYHFGAKKPVLYGETGSDETETGFEHGDVQYEGSKIWSKC